ncbi:hypothetical protein LFM09_07775 [Lentzea alba]|uniref:hypothetical protein n=1 Tax=Lentzea alba TaxID=2714351 RepID=UPI0039BEE23A
MKRTFKTAMASLIVAASLLTAPPAGHAQKPAEDVGITGIGEATDIKAEPTWIRFRPDVNYGPHLVLEFGTDIASICQIYGADNLLWSLVYDHDKRFVGFTHSDNLTHTRRKWCPEIGKLTNLQPQYNPAWVRMHPVDNWAHETVQDNEDIVSHCWISFGGESFDLVVARRTKTVGFIRSAYLANPGSLTRCTT